MTRPWRDGIFTTAPVHHNTNDAMNKLGLSTNNKQSMISWTNKELFINQGIYEAGDQPHQANRQWLALLFGHVIGLVVAVI